MPLPLETMGGDLTLGEECFDELAAGAKAAKAGVLVISASCLWLYGAKVWNRDFGPRPTPCVMLDVDDADDVASSSSMSPRESSILSKEIGLGDRRALVGAT